MKALHFDKRIAYPAMLVNRKATINNLCETARY